MVAECHGSCETTMTTMFCELEAAALMKHRELPARSCERINLASIPSTKPQNGPRGQAPTLAPVLRPPDTPCVGQQSWALDENFLEGSLPTIVQTLQSLFVDRLTSPKHDDSSYNKVGTCCEDCRSRVVSSNFSREVSPCKGLSGCWHSVVVCSVVVYPRGA